MNSRSYKTVFSKRLGALVAVGEHASSQGKANGASVGVSFAGADWLSGAARYVGTLTASFALVSLVWAGPVTTVAPTALPTGGQLTQGAASINTSGAVMNINQSTAKAVLNWTTFDIGQNAKVNITQPGADAVMLNRVTSANPSQILGQLNANGQVVLVNPNGVLFGKDGSVNASSFTASTLGISDANFMAGSNQFERNGSTAAVVNRGRIKTTGGYVALLGASVSNEGQIQTQGGTAYLAAAETVKIPVSGSGRIKLELSPSRINAAVANAKGGTIVTEGGQVYMQAAALNSAVASIIQSGSIDTTGTQGGAVHLLADGGHIKVDGSIRANSTINSNKGGDIVIGRDEETGVLAKSTDASEAALESQRGFVETSGELLATTGTRVTAQNWLLDPTDISIDAGATTSPNWAGTAQSASSILASDIAFNLNQGTNVTIQTSAVNTGAQLGDITVNSAISKTAGGNATLTMTAHNNIVLNAGISASTGQLTTVLNAGGTGGIGGGSAGTINANGGALTLNSSNAAASGTLAGVISGTGSSLTKTGAGTISLTAANTYTGATTISGGVLQLQNTNASASYDIQTNGTLELNVASGTRDMGVGVTPTFGGAGTLRKTGAGGVQWLWAATFAMARGSLIDVQAGTFKAGHNGDDVWTNNKSDLNVAAGATVSTVEAAVRVNKLTGNGTISIGYNNSLSPYTNAGLYIGVDNNYDKTANAENVVSTFGGMLQDWNGAAYGRLFKSGTGTQILTGNNTNSGTTSISGGTLQVGNGGSTGALGAADVTLSNNANLSYVRATATTIANNISGAGNLSSNITGAVGGDLTVSGNVTLTGASTVTLKASGDITVAAAKTISTATGAVVINSDSDASGSGAIKLLQGSAINTSGASITLGGGSAGTGAGYAVGNSTNPNGILLDGASLSTGGGSITLRGKSASDTSSYDYRSDGVRLRDASGNVNVNSGNGQISITGISQTTYADSGHGVEVGTYGSPAYATTLISSNSGANAITITGTGASNSSTLYSDGIMLSPRSSILSTNAAGGDINLVGTGNKQGGVYTLAGARVLSAKGTINITGAALAEPLSGIVLRSAVLGYDTSGVTSSSANINLTADSMSLDASTTVKTTGNVTLANKTAGTKVDVGGADVAGAPATLGLTSAELALITASNTVIGSATAGDLKVSAALSTSDATGHLTLVSGGNVAFNASVQTGTTGTKNLTVTAAGAISQSAGSLTSGTLGMTATTGTIGNVVQRIITSVANLSMSAGGDEFVSQDKALRVAARTTASNGSIDIINTNGGLTVAAVNGITGITSHGTGNVSIAGNTTTGIGVTLANNITASGGDITIRGTTSSTTNYDAGVKSWALVSGVNVTMQASATAASGTMLGYYGAGGQFAASAQLNLSASSNSAGNGFYSYTGSLTAGTGMVISGTSTAGQGLGLDNRVTLTNTTGDILLTGTATDPAKQAIGLNGFSITNGGGNTVVNALNGSMNTGSGNIAWGSGVLSNAIVSNGTGVVQINAGNNSAGSSSSIDGSVLTITQNSNAGVVLNTSGAGNVTAPKVINNGTGNVTIAAGTQIPAGTGTGGQVLTLAGNTVTQASSGKTYVYTGAAASTGSLSNISASLASLYNQGSGHTWNAAFNQAYGSTIAAGAATQVLFRESTAPSFNLDLSAIVLSKTYGQNDPDVFAAIQAAYAGSALTKVVAGAGGSNTFAVASNDVLPTLAGTRAAGENASITPYAYAITAGLSTVVTAQPNLLINKAPLSVALQGLVQKEYDGTTAGSGLTNANYNVTGWITIGGVTEGASVNQPFASYASATVAANTGTGAVTATLQASNFVANAGTNLSNYTLPTSASGNVGTITRAPLTVKVNNTAMFVTQDPNTAADNGIAYTGLKNGESAASVLGALSRTYTGAANPAAGSYSGVYDLTTVPTAANYTVTVQKGDLTVARADQLLLNLGSTSATYGALTASNAGASATSVTAQYCLVSTNCNGANIANLTMTNSGAGRWRATDVANSTISFDTVVDTTGRISGAGFVNAGNYIYTTANLTTTGTVNFNGTVVSGGVLTVDPKPLTLNASNVTKVYDGTTALAGMPLGLTGSLTGDQVSVTSSGGTFAGKTVGSQSFSLTGLQLQGADRANYGFASNSVTGTGTITPKTLTLSASAADKAYDGNTTASLGALSVSGAIAGDTVSATGGNASFADKNVARDASGRVIAKSVTISGVTLTGADAVNYQTDSGASVTATITPLTVNASVTAQNKVYDGTTQAQVSGTVAGTMGADAVSVTSTSSTFASKNVVRDAAGRPASQSVNVSGLTLTGADAVNYNLASTTATSTATITPKVLSASGAVADKVYDGTAQASLTGLNGAGIVTGDAVTVQASSAVFSDKNVARDASGNVIAKTVTVTGLSIGGADAGNYELMGSRFTAQASILPRSLNVVATAQDKVYDGSTAATGGVSASNIVAGDALQLSWTPGQFASKDVSRNAQGQVQPQAVSFGKLQISGADVGNYSLGSGTASTTAAITPKVLQVSGTLVADKPEDGNTTAKVTMGTLTGLVGQEQLLGSAIGDFQSASAGSDKPVDVSYSLQNGANGGNAGNYLAPSQVLRASIIANSKNNPVQPVVLPAKTGGNSPLRVVVVTAQAAVADLESQNESRQECSFLNPEKCACEETAVQGVQMCVTPPEVASRTPQDRLSSLALPLSR